ncbi:MAG: hypothetical protein PWQ73_712, partial [Petrotoga sp.]|nr:hypothetical protein [Petrotoga sp.]
MVLSANKLKNCEKLISTGWLYDLINGKTSEEVPFED